MTTAHERRSLDQILGRVECPACHAPLAVVEVGEVGPFVVRVRCASADAHEFPVVAGIPVLLTDDASFRAADVAGAADTTYFARRVRESRLKARLRKALPSPGLELGVAPLDQLVSRSLPPGRSPWAGLMIGAGTHAEDVRGRIPGVDWLVTDIDTAFGADVVADVLSLPVPDASIDLVVVEHVLEHVVDPIAAGREIERVLRIDGLVLAKVPFTFPWHGGYVDFFRCTPAGLRALFARTDVLHIAPSMGPASAVVYACQALLSVPAHRRGSKVAALVAGRVALAPFKHIDRALISRPDSAVAAGAIAYLGRRTTTQRTAAELVSDARAIGRGDLGRPKPATSPPPT